MIAIIDAGIGNVNAIANMLKKLGADSIVTKDQEELAQADKMILPGVGAFDPAMQELDNLGLLPLLHHKAVEEKIPVLGICLGMQLLTNGSEEGQLRGLGWIPGFAHKFPPDNALKVPHMKWNGVVQTKPSALTEELDPDSKFYFVHSYYVTTDPGFSILQSDHGIRFDAAVQNENIFGVQFHPEKSHKYGMKILSNFAKL